LPVFAIVITCTVLVVPMVREAKVSDGGVRETAGASAMPVPDNATECGLPTASLVTVSVPVRGPAMVGVNVTVNTHAFVGPGFIVAGHDAVLLKSPEVVTDEMCSGPVPVLVIDTVWAALGVPTFCDGNTSDGGLMATPGVSTTPVPDNGTVCGLPSASLVIVSVPLRGPAAVGVNVTVMEQDAVGAIGPTHPLTLVKSPVAVTRLMFSGALPELLIDSETGVLDVPTTVDGNGSDDGEIVMPGTGAADTLAVTMMAVGLVYTNGDDTVMPPGGIVNV
jgi:hypothetical protein